MPTVRSIRPTRSLALVVVAALAVGACSSERVTAPAAPVASGSVPSPAVAPASTEPHFLLAAPDAPPVANPVVHFWAKRGDDRTLTMWYHRAPGERDSVALATLRVKAKSLWLRPDGTAFAQGDSILITATLVDPARLIVDFQPSGLRFSPDAPARLKMSWAHTDDDMNGDGQVDAADRRLVRALAIWRREAPLDPWMSLDSRVTIGLHEVEAEIGGFTGYSIAW